MDRRTFLQHGVLSLGVLTGAGLSAGTRPVRAGVDHSSVHDLQSGLDEAFPSRILRPKSVHEVQEIVVAAARAGVPLCVSGRRHSSGGQSLLDGAWMLDVTGLQPARYIDVDRGEIAVEAGIQWPALMAFLRANTTSWTIRQKQSIAGVTLGGSISANAHGNGLTMPPISADVAWLELVDSVGNLRRCSREQDPDLFFAVIGGFGQLGIVTALGLRLQRRRHLRRLVEFVRVEEAAGALDRRMRNGALYGSCILFTQLASADHLRRGILVYDNPDDEGDPQAPSPISTAAWLEEMRLLHRHPEAAWSRMCDALLASAGMTYLADDLLMSGAYVDHYHRFLDEHASEPGADVLVEFMVPPSSASPFIGRMRGLLSEAAIQLLLCELRLVAADRDTVLSYVRQPSVAIALTVHVNKTPRDLENARHAMGRCLDEALMLGGSFHPAFSWCASPARLQGAFPRLDEWRSLKHRFDPQQVFRSRWYDELVNTK